LVGTSVDGTDQKEVLRERQREGWAIEVDRQRRKDEAMAWQKDSDRAREELAKELQAVSDRLARVETFGTAALVIIGVLNSFGLVRRLRGAEVKTESVTPSGRRE
jgi:hypothetical protein